MTDQQKHQAIDRVITATNAQIEALRTQLEVLAAYVDLLKNLNAAEVEKN